MAIFSAHGVLGINARNQKYIKTTKKSRQILDSKLLTKDFLSKKGIPVLDTVGIIKTRKELFNFNWDLLPDSFALKPNRGFGGGGIIVLYGRKKKFYKQKKEENENTKGDENLIWIRADGTLVTKEELETHVFDILEGNFSLSYMPDTAFFEERAKVVKELKPYTWKGIPDIRIVVFEGVPVMAMLRLPTKESRGRANLHNGAIGVGIDLVTGKTLSAVHYRDFIDYYPGTRYLLRGIQVPHFKNSLNLAVSIQKHLKVKFLGIDITIDREKGPVVLEVNLRPGLQVQTANMAGLGERLKRIKGLSLKSEKRGIRIAQQLFGEEEYEEEEVFGKKVLGVIEEIEIPYKEIKKGKEVERKLNIERFVTKKIVRSSLGEEIRPVVPVSFDLKGEKVDTEVFIADRSQMRYEIIIGRRDLAKFIVDPSKTR
jgi:alpha-L-glutamate ligase-like protein